MARFTCSSTSINNFPATVSIGYAASPDGYTWSLASTDLVLKYAPTAIFASSVLVGDDGVWTLYFYTVDAATHPHSTMGRATAPKPTGP
jgi:hypothetical protein